MAGSFYTRKVGVLADVSVTEQVLREISKFSEIMGKLSMRKQCVPGSFLPAHAREPGNEASYYSTRYRMRMMQSTWEVGGGCLDRNYGKAWS